jgi:conjugal transfer pilus assembly protein TraV
MKKLRILYACAAAATLAGCSMTGYDAKSSFSCKAPEGVLCNSMTGIYANAMAHNLPEQKVHSGSGAETNVTLGDYAQDAMAASSARGANGPSPLKARGALTPPLDSGLPIHTAPRELRVWFAPWKDTDADLHDQEYVYLIVDHGHWSIEHNQGRIREAYRPVLPPDAAPAAPQPAGPAGAPAPSVPREPVTPGDVLDSGESVVNPSGASSDPFAGKSDRVMKGILTPAGAVDRAATIN